MNSILLKRAGISLAAVCGVVVAASIFTSPAKADQWDKMTLLTTNEPMQVGDTYLEAGTYMFNLADSNRHIVQIFNRDRSHLYNTIIAIPDYRVTVTSYPQFTFWETPPGTAKALRAWFYPGDNFGQEFPYPAHLRQIALRTSAPLPVAPPPAAPVAAEPPPAAPQAESSRAPEAAIESPAPQVEEQEQVEIAQNTPPPAPAAPAPAPAVSGQPTQPDGNANSALPQTASPYPAMGLCGFLALGLYFGLRMKATQLV